MIEKNARQQLDITARYGGEEFVVILPSCENQQALRTAERIREKIENIQLTYEKNVVPITASLGVATTVACLEGEAGLLLDAADRALYMAKGKGRNCVVTVPCHEQAAEK